MKKLPKKELRFSTRLLLVVLLSGFLTVTALWIEPVSLIHMLLTMLRLQPHLLLLNWLPLLLTLLALSLLLQNVFFAAALTDVFWCGLSLANRVKIQIRDEPVYPRDLGLLKEAAQSVGNYSIRYPWLQIAVVLGTVAVFTALGFRFRNRPLSGGRGKRLLHRIGGFAAAAGVSAALLLTLYASSAIYHSFTCSYFDHITTVYNELGFPYCFCYNFSTYQIERPAGFSKAEAAAYEEAGETTSQPNVHVIMVMNEAFSDLTDSDVFTYGAEDDPLTHLHALQDEKNTVSGHLVVPNFAGGTANTEFDVLTGMQTTMLSSANTSAFRTVSRNTDSLLRVFDADGYSTLFMHPGSSWFYNRENVYRWLGAETSLFEDDMENPEYKGSWVTDDYMFRQITSRFESAVANGETLCNMTVTIQNHMSYTADKYGDAVIPPVQTSASLSAEANTILSVYTEGIRDADAMLGKLTDYFRASDEPVLLVFWGDHLPYLGDDRLCYRELGLEIAQLDDAQDPFIAYETPFVIWCNDAAASELDFSDRAAALELPADHVINASYLGATVLELTGRKDEDPWFSFLCDLRRELPVYHSGKGETADGQLFTETPESLQEPLRKLENWTYYRMKYKTVD